MFEQLSLLDWKPSAEVLPFPFHRSHGATVAVARLIKDLDTPKRSGRLNGIRAATRKRLEPIVGEDRADKAADDLVRMIKVAFAYCDNSHAPKQKKAGTVIFIEAVDRTGPFQHSNGGGEADAWVKGLPCAGMGRVGP